MVYGAKPQEHEADVVFELRAAGWQAEPLWSFKRKGERICVVTAPAPPSFRVLNRGKWSALVINDYTTEELPRAPRKVLAQRAPPKRRRTKLPATELPTETQCTAEASEAEEWPGKRKLETSTPEAEPSLIRRAVKGVVGAGIGVMKALSPQRRREEEAADQQMSEEHSHSFDTGAQPRAGADFICDICGASKKKGQVRRPCLECGMFACAVCVRQ